MRASVSMSSVLLASSLALGLLSAGCDDSDDGDDAGVGGDGEGTDEPGGSVEGALSACFFSDSAVYCAPTDWAEGDDLRVRVEDFYPSACVDDDADGDRVPDFLDLDGDGGDFDDDLRCGECDRGPGESGDFRFEVDGDEAKLDRGTVYLYDADEGSLTVPAPHGEALTIQLAYAERIEDGLPTPGSEIRAEGEIDEDGVLWAERVKVLCAAPDPLPPEDVPPDCEAVDPHDGDDDD
jgi:hypothetical protein